LFERGTTSGATEAVKASPGGSFAASVAETKTTPASVVVVIQEIFGVNQAMRGIAAWIADLGFVAVAPELF
jgi:carboxymethylenebutenolidase